jgi:CHAT domain-containing protein
MKIGVGILCLALLLPASGPAPRPPQEKGLPRLKLAIAAIIDELVLCFERGREPRFLEMAMRFAEIKTHPLFDLEWGQHARNAVSEAQLLASSERLRSRLGEGGCLPRDGESELCRLAQEYIRANDLPGAASGKAALDLPESCGLGRMQRSLSPSQLLLKYVMLGDRVLLFYIGPDQAGYEVLSVGRAQVGAMVARLTEPLEDFASGKVDYLRIHFDMELAHRLYNVLLKGVDERFPRAEELLIIPDGDLYKLPFEALVTDFKVPAEQDDALFSEYRAADFVIQDHTVSYFFSFSDFLRRFQGRADYPYAMVAFGHPLPPAADEGAPPQAAADIPSTRQEVLNLGVLFSPARRRIFTGADFNRANFTRFAPQAKLIHLATHFFSDEKDPSRSAFLFSATGGSPALCDTRQILSLHLPAELMILSACETSEKDLLGFRLISGMTAAIRRAGVRDMIASLWPVDELSSQVVPLFYRDYLDGGGSAASLRRSKLALLGRTIGLRDGVRLALAHPFIWANYVLYRFCR